MIDVGEHVYHDDPASGHPDVRTYLNGASYFFLGNGLIQAAIQFAPAGEGSPYGLLVVDPDRLRMKRDALSFDPETGLEQTMLVVAGGDGLALPARGPVRVAWADDTDIPTVVVTWEAGHVLVTERFWCPDRSTPRLVRDVRLQATNGRCWEAFYAAESLRKNTATRLQGRGR